MPTNPEPTVRDLFEAFVYFRRQGATPDYALQELRKMKPSINANEREELAVLVRRWESSEGARYRPNPNAYVQPLPTHRQAESSNDGILCSNCGAANRTDASYCYACGEVLLTYGTHRLATTDEENENAFNEQTRLIFIVRGFEDYPIEVNVHQRSEMILGRAAADNPIVPDVDLNDYDGMKHGVSRVHATLKYADGSITITDMGSINHSFINGERVYPQEVRMLRDGDELRLGRLVMHVSFQKALKRIRN